MADGWTPKVYRSVLLDALSSGASARIQRIVLLPPVADATVHRDHLLVAHFLEIVRREGGAEAAAAIKNDLLPEVGHARFNVSLDDALPQVDGAGQMVLGELALL